jgi:hypothetical protein
MDAPTQCWMSSTESVETPLPSVRVPKRKCKANQDAGCVTSKHASEVASEEQKHGQDEPHMPSGLYREWHLDVFGQPICMELGVLSMHHGCHGRDRRLYGNKAGSVLEIEQNDQHGYVHAKESGKEDRGADLVLQHVALDEKRNRK